MNIIILKMNRILLCYFVFLSISSFAQVFLRREGQNIVDGNGQNIVLRGLGLGGWMVQEGYMLKTGAFASPQHVIKQKITDLIGVKYTDEFYKAYKTNGITKRDIDSLAAWGFNSIRLPMHYNLYTPSIQEEKDGQITWLEEGFKMTDDLLKWCAINKMYLILDLHAAPGGQGKDAAISDFDESKPSLWESAVNQQKMISFWKKIAERYKDNPWIGGYDIINEPNWNFSGTNQNGCDETGNVPLRDLMIKITKSIRDVDKNHIVIIEGNCWGNNYNGIFPLWDENMVLSFHKYWNSNDQATIQTMLDYRTKYNVPIWLGESGENSNVWFKDCISLVESNNIGWAFWPMKKIDNIAGICSIKMTPEYQILLDYWKNGGTKPTELFAYKTLMQLADGYKIENVDIKSDVIDAMFRQVGTKETKAYKKSSVPGKIFATDYDLGQNGFAYFDTDIENKEGTKFTPSNKGYQMRNDGVDIIKCNDVITNGFQVYEIEDNEWLQFTINVKTQKKYEVAIRYSSEISQGSLFLEKNNERISETIELPVTGGFEIWKTIVLKNVKLNKGIQKVRLHALKGKFNINYLEYN